MSLLEYIESFENNLFANVKEMTEKFNELKFNERKVFFELEGQYVQMNISYWQLMMICK